MNTTAYGEDFEVQVYNFLKNLLSSDDIPGASAKRSKIFHHKKYNTQTDRTIIADVSIETYISQEHEDRGEWSTLIIFECKRYKNTVDIADLDEFESKLRKMGGYGVKGFFVTTSNFSKQSIIEARKYHYGLAIFSKDGNWNWLVPRDTRRDKNEEYAPILYGEYPIGSSPLFWQDGCFYNVLDILKASDVALPTSKKYKVPFLPKDKVRAVAKEIYLSYPNIDDDIAGNLLFKLFPKFRVTFENLPYGVEGLTSFKEKRIILSNSLTSKPERLRFTLAHELGHLVLHADLLAFSEGIFDNSPHPLSDNDMKWLDVHANQFASAILIPETRFHPLVHNVFQQTDIRTQKFIVDNQPFKAKMLQTILSNLASHFKVSKEAMFIRLKEDGFITDIRKKPERISNIFRRY